MQTISTPTTKRTPCGRLLLLPLILSIVGFALLGAGCAPVSIRVTVRDDTGNPLAGLVVSARGKTATTDAWGVAVLSGLEPGLTEITVTGEGYQAIRTESFKAGTNQVDISLSPPSLTLRDLEAVASLRLRFVAVTKGKTEVTECAIIRTVGSHWKLTGPAEFIALGDTLYITSDGKWQKVQGGAFVAGLVTAIADGFLVGYQGFLASVAAPGIEVRPLGTGQANGYPCRIYELSGPASGEWVRARVHVISSGPYAGYATRAYWENSVGDSLTSDLFDLGAEFTIKAPL